MPDQSAYRFTPFAFDPGGQSGGSWSPDGKAFAYTGAGTEGNSQIFIRYLGFIRAGSGHAHPRRCILPWQVVA